MIEAWASVKSFTRKDGSGPPPSDGGRNATVDFKGEKRCNETHQSTTDPDARLYKKGDGDESRLCYLCHTLMENINGLLVDVIATLASGTAERDARSGIASTTRWTLTRAMTRPLSSRTASPGCDAARGPEKHIAIDGRTTRQVDYAASIKKRKLVEEKLSWSKTICGLRKARFIGQENFALTDHVTFGAYNLTRIATIVGWRL